MQFSTLLASLSIASLATANSFDLPSRPENDLVARQDPSSGPCSSGVKVLATGGANASDEYSYGLLVTLAQGIVNAIPGSSMDSVPYDKLNVTTSAIAAGGQTLAQYVNGYHATCPNGKIVLVGYSSGAIITMNGICQGILDQGLADSTIIATVVYGDQTRVPGLSYDKGTCTGAGNLTRVRNPAQCGAFIPGIQSYCDTNDPQCCDGPPEDYQIHFVYPKEYDTTATDFVVQRWNAIGGGASVNTNSSSSSSSSSSTATSSSTGTRSSSSTSSGSSRSTSSSGIAIFPTTGSSAPATTVTSTAVGGGSSSTTSTSSMRTSSAAATTSALQPTNGAGSLLPSLSLAVVLSACGLYYIL